MSIQFPQISAEDRRYQAISKILQNHHNLKYYCFKPTEIKLRCSAEELLEKAFGFSSGERLLIKIALDVWNGTGDAKISEIINKLDDQNYINVIEGLKTLCY